MLKFNPNIPYADFNYFSAKNLDELDIFELAYIHLKSLTRTTKLKNCSISSNLYDLRETLTVSFNNRRTNQYVPLMTSFAILDQMGALYTPLGKSRKKGNKENHIKLCLKFNTNLTNLDINSLVSLRNGLLHNGSLLCLAKYPSQPNVLYRLTKTGTTLITHPQSPWDGAFHDNMQDYLSVIDLIKLKDMVYHIHDRLFDMLIKDNLRIEITCRKEFYFKYLFAH